MASREGWRADPSWEERGAAAAASWLVGRAAVPSRVRPLLRVVMARGMYRKIAENVEI